MDFLPEKISRYCEEHTTPESELLYDLNRKTHLQTTRPRMLSGHLQGRFLAMISRLIGPKFILEIGTFTGYSALCLAEGLSEKGKLVTLDNNPETNAMACRYFSASPYADQIELIETNAQDYLTTLKERPDLVFIDADKENYPVYFELVLDKLQPGGIILADNVLWSGKVTENAAKNDRETEALMRFNDLVQKESRVENILFPLRDGLMMIRKKA
jgi:caffeoyl-CoA O-methyltransferase